ncbi:MAG TPA: ATP-dependent RecD-like DNA helicase [Polyangiaceae bacterium]|nr:ATP-dependent RecD-like DNA helicase [Polyangiaceae bacterium]
MPITLSGEVERVTYESESTSFRVLRVGSLEGEGARSGSIAVVGTFQAVGPGTRIRITGNFVTDARHGEQLRADVVVPIEPNTLVGLERYLGSGLIPGVGSALAKRIVEAFGLETLRVLDEQPDRLASVPGLGERRVKDIKASWKAQRALSSVLVLLQSHGASHNLALRIWKHYGDRAASIVQRSPYRLALEVKGVGFKTADRLAHAFGISHDHPERCQAGVIHMLEEFSEAGHVYVPREELVPRVAEMLEVGEPHIEVALDALYASERIVLDGRAVYLTYLHRAELEVTAAVQRLCSQPAKAIPGAETAIEAFEKRGNLKLAPSQRSAVELAVSERIAIITGGPGVGKTTIIRAIVSVFETKRRAVRLAAPTGRAAKRLSEATGHEASTLHRLLEFEPRSAEFQRGPERPLEADVVIVDEASMIDLPLMRSLLLALPPAARIVIVGDADQLPSVGPGAVLRDLLESRVVPTVRLSEVFRQAETSAIVVNAHVILRGEMPETTSADSPRGDFFIVPRKTAEEAAETIRELVAVRIPRRFGLDPRKDIQVLTPMHRGPAGTAALNEVLQRALNPEGPALEVRGQKLRLGDKVIQTRNDYENEVFNGDVGVITAVDTEERKLSVRFDNNEVVYEEGEVEALTLAYAMSVHKSQGSEYPAVVFPLLTSHFVMLAKSLLYTGVTRARKLCVLVADPKALSLAVSDARREERRTRLAERIAFGSASPRAAVSTS